MNEKVEFLPVDIYHFLGHDIGIKSNSPEVLTHFKSTYGRFYLGADHALSSPQGGPAETPRPLIEVTDDLVGSNEILVNDGSEFFRLKCKNLNEFDYDYYTSPGTVPNPLAHIDALFIMKVYDLAKDYHMFHSGSVSWENQGIIFPGLSGMGKSTLTLKLVKKGFGFLSDEAACINPEKESVHPFCLKLKLSDESLRLLDLPSLPETYVQQTGPGETEWMMDIEDIIPSSIADSCTLRYILFLQGFGEKPRLEYVSPSNALFRLLRFSFLPVSDPAGLLYKFAPLLNHAKCFNLVMGDPDETAEAVMRMANVGSAGKDEATI